jgi:hypothetical protein
MMKVVCNTHTGTVHERSHRLQSTGCPRHLRGFPVKDFPTARDERAR